MTNRSRRLPPVRSERGITLVEVTVVGVLAAIVMLALTGFYVNSQGNWIDASGQAVTQRDASFILSSISDSVHVASTADVPPGTNTLILNDITGTERCRFWLSSADQRIHLGINSPSVDQGPVATSKVTQFVLSKNDSMVYVAPLEMQNTSNHPVSMSIAATMYNRVVP